MPYELMEGAATASSLLKSNLAIDHSVIDPISTQGKGKSRTPNKIVEAFRRSREALFSGNFDIVVLNGVHDVLDRGLLPLEDILALMEQKPENVELVLSGTRTSEQIIEKADLVTEMIVCNPKNALPEKGIPEDHGTIEVVTGNGKGKTTYCLGKALLTSCLDIRSIVLQFIKSPKAYGEVKAVSKLPYIEIKTMGKGLLKSDSAGPSKKHLEAARQAWEECLREIFSLKYGLVVLDEINVATHYGLTHAERVREMLFLKPRKLHLILSGRNAHLEVKEGATSVIEMREIKHPYKKGIKARKGIEF